MPPSALSTHAWLNNYKTVYVYHNIEAYLLLHKVHLSSSETSLSLSSELTSSTPLNCISLLDNSAGCIPARDLGKNTHQDKGYPGAHLAANAKGAPKQDCGCERHLLFRTELTNCVEVPVSGFLERRTVLAPTLKDRNPKLEYSALVIRGWGDHWLHRFLVVGAWYYQVQPT